MCDLWYWSISNEIDLTWKGFNSYIDIYMTVMAEIVKMSICFNLHSTSLRDIYWEYSHLTGEYFNEYTSNIYHQKRYNLKMFVLYIANTYNEWWDIVVLSCSSTIDNSVVSISGTYSSLTGLFMYYLLISDCYRIECKNSEGQRFTTGFRLIILFNSKMILLVLFWKGIFCGIYGS